MAESRGQVEDHVWMESAVHGCDLGERFRRLLIQISGITHSVNILVDAVHVVLALVVEVRRRAVRGLMREQVVLVLILEDRVRGGALPQRQCDSLRGVASAGLSLL